MANCLSIEKKPHWIPQQTVVPGQMPEITGTVIELGWSDTVRYLQRQFTVGGGKLSWSTCWHGSSLVFIKKDAYK